MSHHSPFWLDPSTALHVAAPQPFHYLPVAPAPPPTLSPRLPNSFEPPVPRPRKPYTTTKVREMWSPTEHNRMLEGLKLFKRDWAKVTQHVATRSIAQVRSHAQKYFDKVAREKTNDYVPRARPKRKSATPYPRKIRQQLPPTLRTSATPPTLPPQTTLAATLAATPPHPHAIAIPIPQLHPAVAPSHAMQSAPPIHPAQIHLQYAAAPPAYLPHVSHSPYLSQPQRQQLVQPVFSPYMNMCSPHSPNIQPPNYATSAHPSPTSYMSAHPYSANSHPTHHSIPVAHHPVYNMFSPITPATYGPPVATSSSIPHNPASLIPITHIQQHQLRKIPMQTPHIPTHSHPGGPLQNCAKCNALRRYGGVLEEIIRVSAPQTTQSIISQSKSSTSPRPAFCKSNQASFSSPRSQRPDKSNSSSVAEQSSTAVENHGNNIVRSPSPSQRHHNASPTSAKIRARRAKIIKSRKLASKPRAFPETRNNVSCEDTSDYNRGSYGKDSSSSAANAVSQERELNKTERTSRTASVEKRHDYSPKQSNTDCSDTIRSMHSSPKRKRDTGDTPNSVSKHSKETKGSVKRPRSGKATKSEPERQPSLDSCTKSDSCNNIAACDEARKSRDKDDFEKTVECEKKEGSPLAVASYSQKERKELFDAVQSLQALSRTSSSPSSHSSYAEME